MVWNRVPRIDWISIGLLCELCGSVVNPVDDSHRPELNHRDTEDTEDSASKEPQMKFCGLRSSLCSLRLCGEIPSMTVTVPN